MKSNPVPVLFIPVHFTQAPIKAEYLFLFRKAFEERENGICEEILIQNPSINIRSNEEYVDLDDGFNDVDDNDNITLHSDEGQDSIEEDDSSKF